MNIYNIEKVYNAGSKKLFNIVCPTGIEELISITITRKDNGDLPRFFYRPTIPFDHYVPNNLNKSVLISDKKDQYCSCWSEKSNHSDKNQKLELTNETIGEFWNIVKKKYGQRDNLYVKDVDFSTIVFESSLEEYSQIYVKYDIKK